MTRETKVGLVVAASFLCLVGVVVASRLGRHADKNDNQPLAQSAAPAQQEEPAKNDAKKSPSEAKTGPSEGEKKVSANGPALPKPNTTAPVQSPTAFGFGGFKPALPAVSPPGALPPVVHPPDLNEAVISPMDEQHKDIMAKLKQAQAPTKPADVGLNSRPEGFDKSAPPLPTTPLASAAGPLPNNEPEAKTAFVAENKKTDTPLSAPAGVKPFEAPAASESAKIEKKTAPDNNLFADPPAAITVDKQGKIDKAKDFPPGLPPGELGPVASPMSVAAVAPAPKQEFTITTPPAPMMDAKTKNAEPLLPVGNISTAPGPGAFNRELAKESVPPLGAEVKNPLPPITINPAGGGTLPQVKDIPVESYECTPEDTSFEAISLRRFGSPKYAKALLRYNRDFFLARDNIRQEDNPRLQPRQIVFIPTREFLEERFAALIDSRPIATGQASAPAISISPPLNANGPSQRAGIPPLQRPANPSTPDATKSYRVPGDGQMLIEIAQQTLGDRGRWSEIYRLNPTLRPEFPIPGGTEIRLPGNSPTQ